jgi:APA family basic amino acid/polyamine antiporter
MVRLRMRPDPGVTYRARPNVSLGGVEWPVFAIFGGLATGASFVVILVQNPLTRWVGLGWIVAGLVGYALYRRQWVRASLRETVKAPPAFGAALALEYRRIVVPIVPGRPSDDALDVACRLAAERGARVVALTVIEVPLELPLDADLPDEERLANDELDEAMAVGDTYGVRVVGRLVRGRSASVEIVREAERREAEIIVLGSPRKDLTSRRRGVFGSTVDRVMRRAPCRVMVTATRERRAARTGTRKRCTPSARRSSRSASPCWS